MPTEIQCPQIEECVIDGRIYKLIKLPSAAYNEKLKEKDFKQDLAYAKKLMKKTADEQMAMLRRKMKKIDPDISDKKISQELSRLLSLPGL